MGRFGIAVGCVLSLTALGVLGVFYNLPLSSFPYQEPGYHQVYDLDYDESGGEAFPSGEYEWSRGGSSAPLYQSLVPSFLLVWFSFQAGRGYAIRYGKGVAVIVSLGCICLICYCAGWLIPESSPALRLLRTAAFAASGMGFILSWLFSFVCTDSE